MKQGKKIRKMHDEEDEERERTREDVHKDKIVIYLGEKYLYP